MKTKTAIIGCCAVVMLLATLFGWRSHRAIGNARARAVAAEQERHRLTAEVARLEAKITDVRRSQLDVAATPTRSSAGQTRAASASPVERVLQVPPDNVEMQTLALRTFRSGLGLKYGAFYRALGLNAEQIAKFEALLADYEGRKSDIRATERSIPLDRTTAVPFDAITVEGKRTQILMDPAIAKLRREADARLKQEQTALLGEDGYARLQEFEATAESRAFVGDLVGNLALTAHPLTAEQGKGLVRALQAGNFAVRLAPEKTDWDTILAQARPLLAPGQFDELQALAAAHKLKVTRNDVGRLLQSMRR